VYELIGFVVLVSEFKRLENRRIKNKINRKKTLKKISTSDAFKELGGYRKSVSNT
jgi:hypothetical protein